MKTTVSELVGELDRLIEYPRKGYPIAPQAIPARETQCLEIARKWLRSGAVA